MQAEAIKNDIFELERRYNISEAIIETARQDLLVVKRVLGISTDASHV